MPREAGLARPYGGRMVELMRNSDAFTWAMESDPRLRSTVVTVFRLDRSPDWDEVVSRFDRITRTLPSFRRRVVANPPPAPPRWEDDPQFDLGYHLRRVALADGDGFDAVLEMARRAQMADFDRARPLWEVTVVDGLADGGAALVAKLHHALTDGVGGVEIAMVLFDLEQTPADRGAMPSEPVPAQRVPLQGLRETLKYDAAAVASAARLVARSGPAALRAARHPVESAAAAAATAASVYRTVRPLSRTGSPLMKERGVVRRLAVHEVPLADLKRAGHAAGGSLNDAFVAGVLGAVQRYHDAFGADLDDLHVCMPVSLREEGDAVGGNRITLMRIDLPGDERDPRERVRRVHERTSLVRQERSLPYTQAIAGALNLLPRWYIGAVLRHVDVLASDVPGIPVPVWIGGARVLMQHAFGPTIGAAVNVTLMTYVDTCALGIDLDAAAIPDADLFLECVEKSFAEVVAQTS